MLIPSRTKYRRVHRIKYEGKAKGNTKLSFGEYGLMAKEGAWITNNQIEAARIAMTRYMKRGGKVYINIFPQSKRSRFSKNRKSASFCALFLGKSGYSSIYFRRFLTKRFAPASNQCRVYLQKHDFV